MLNDIRRAPFWFRAPGLSLIFSVTVFTAQQGLAGGVTIITHGYNGNVTGWVTGMANKIPQYYRFPGTNFSIYTLSVSNRSGQFTNTVTRVAGAAPSATDSGEIIIKLDWSSLAGGTLSLTTSTSNVAAAVSLALTQTNFIPELGGHALAELPLHLVGHSRGGSLISELSRLLGTNGIWVDHLTTLDPHPINNDGFSDPTAGVDAPVRTYANVLFHDNYWEMIDTSLFDPNGEPVFGAYRHQLQQTNLNGGYSNSTSQFHSNVHLWYHGTIDFATLATDTEAYIGTRERTTWWTTYEAQGTNAGFQYSLLGGADRTSMDQPQGPGTDIIRDGYNQLWDLGIGVSSNRVPLTTNNGAWPNLIRFNRTTTNAVTQGQSTSVKLYYQWAQPTNNQATVSIYLDDDLNLFNSNDRLLTQFALAGNGASNVSTVTVSFNLNSTNAPVGMHALYAKISGSGHTRYLYAPESIQVVANPLPPTVDITDAGAGLFQIGVNGVSGQTIVLLGSTNLLTWQPLVTNTLVGTRFVYPDNQVTPSGTRYYRARLQ
jgi:hypothetical protein